VARRRLSHEGTLVLDCEGLSKFVSDHEPVVALIAEARRRGMEVVISALTIIEAVHRRTDKARLAWVLSGVRIVHIGDEEAKAASAAPGRHAHLGHRRHDGALRRQSAPRRRVVDAQDPNAGAGRSARTSLSSESLTLS